MPTFENVALHFREITILTLTISIVYASHGARNCRRSVRKRTASTISWTLEMLCIGESVFRKSFGLYLCSGVSTTPGATVLARICSFAYSIAMLFDIASMPPLVSMATEAFTPAIG